MLIKKPPVMRLPAEQQALLTTLLPELRRMGNNAHWKFFQGYNSLLTREDLVQATLSRLYTANNYPPADPEQLLRWANTSMRNVALNVLDKAKRDLEGSYGYIQEQDYHNIAAHDSQDRVAHLFSLARQHLRPVVNQVLLGYGLGHSGQQIATTLDIPHSTVRQHFYVARKRLLALSITAT